MALQGYGPAFVTSFKAGCVMGFMLCALGLLNLWILVHIVGAYYTDSLTNINQSKIMYEAIAGYGLGGSAVALFGRVGGGIYTKAADVGADLVGKFERDLPEDDPRNPAVVADNVGDNVGDIAGMGADLFGSFAESACAAMVVSSQSHELFSSWPAMMFPLIIAACGIGACIITSFVATHLIVVSSETEIEPSLKRQILVSTLILTPILFILCHFFLPDTFTIGTLGGIRNYHIFFCLACGLWSGMIIGYITEYFTSHAYTPVREVANACETGAATNIIYGLALGYKSVIIPVFCMAITIFVSYRLAGMYGIACAALGILSPLSIDLTIDAYGPICDNAGGIAEMSHLPPEVREKTDALDGAGNTTAAIGKGFAIGSAAFVSLALFGAFVTTVGLAESGVDILQPFQFAGLLVGAMLPYWFSAMTMKSVGKAANDMVIEVRRQFREIEGVLAGTTPPDYARCVAISTEAALREMIAPACLVLFTPIIVGFLFGVKALAGLLAGALVSGVQMAISSSNTGGAWDNAKKYIAAGGLGEDKKKHSEPHKAAVIGDTVGDPLKDTSGPSLNILIKLMAIISLVFAPSFPSIKKGGLLEQLFS
jgi:inorganic pyrophosphatase